MTVRAVDHLSRLGGKPLLPGPRLTKVTALQALGEKHDRSGLLWRPAMQRQESTYEAVLRLIGRHWHMDVVRSVRAESPGGEQYTAPAHVLQRGAHLTYYQRVERQRSMRRTLRRQGMG